MKNYRALVELEFKNFLEENSHYSFCEAIYAFLRLDRGNTQLVKDVKHITDQRAYNLINKAIKEERP